MTRRLSVEQLERSVKETVERVGQRREDVIIEENGQAVAAVVPISEYEAILRSRKAFWNAITEIQEANRDVDAMEAEEAIEQAIRETRGVRRNGADAVDR